MGTTAHERVEDGGGGDPADRSGDGSGAGGGTSNDGGGAASGGGNAGGATTLDRSKLNPLLQNMPEDQINQVFDTMFAALRKTSEPDLSGVPRHARPATEQTEVPKKLTREALKTMLDPNSDDFNPEAAFGQFVQENYGSLINDISRNANVGLKADLRKTLPDFDQYEKEVDEIVSAMPSAQVNQATYAQAYFTVKGFKQTQKEYQERQKPPTTRTPSPARPDVADVKLSSEELEVAKVMFRGAADPVAEYKKANKMMENQHIRVPGDAPKEKK